ncbi:MAG: hypothetical protein ACJ8LM_15490, partial [Candidatus Udaeobacter sp.]
LKSEDIRWNGTFTSSAADIAIFSVIFGFFHLLAFVLGFSPKAHLLWGLGAGAVAILAEYVIVTWLVSRHLQLQQDQLNYVATNLGDEVRAKILKAL